MISHVIALGSRFRVPGSPQVEQTFNSISSVSALISSTGMSTVHKSATVDPSLVEQNRDARAQTDLRQGWPPVSLGTWTPPPF